MRVDENGYFWNFVVQFAVGAAIGAGAELISDLIDDGKINNDWKDYVGSALSGGIGALGGGLISTTLLYGAGDVVGDIVSGDIKNVSDAVNTFLTGAAIGGVGKVLSNGVRLYKAGSKMDNIVGNWNASNIKIIKKLAKAGYGHLKIGRDGYQGILDSMYEETSDSFVGDLYSLIIPSVVG